jgi:hypothetical protein
MNNLKSIWTKLKCLLIGFDYNLISDSSIKSKKLLTQYFSAILILIIVWFFVGFQLIREYVNGDDLWLSLGTGFTGTIIVIMVERQIILSQSVNFFQKLVRIFLGFVMAFIGATVIDAALFRNDIEIKKKIYNKEKINKRVQIRINELEKQYTSKEDEKTKVLLNLEKITSKIAKKGSKIKTFTSSYKSYPKKDSIGNQMFDLLGKPITYRVYDRQTILVDNPEMLTADRLRSELNRINQLLETNSQKKFDLRELVIKEVNSEKGIIEDLLILKELLMENRVGLFFYLAFFSFFLMIEMLVILSKLSASKQTFDYYEKIKYQEELSMLKLKRLMKNSSNEI